MNKGKVKIGFSLANNGYWSCEQVKTKILEYISDTEAEINVVYPNGEFDDDFYVDISVDICWANRLDFSELMQWCEFSIVGGIPFLVPSLLAYKANCPSCHTICRKAIEEV